MELSPPKYVLEALRRLEGQGHSAYLVGGCVRDFLLGRRPKDWDLCTSARPEEVQTLFPRSYPTGLAHGTVTVIFRGGKLEITTFRADGDYLDHRRPSSVRFTDSLEEDLARRDFTINAMALSADGRLIDPFRGQADLSARLLRCVGEPRMRFEEDALRMLRALRFSSQLGFSIAPKTLEAIRERAHLVPILARERVSAELEKILLSPAPGTLSDLLSLGLLSPQILPVSKPPDLSVLKRLPKKRLLRWTGFCALLRKAGLLDQPRDFLTALRLDSQLIRHCSVGLSLAERRPECGPISWKNLLSAHEEETVRCCAAACELLYGQGSMAALTAVLKSGDCYTRAQLAVNGEDLKALGFSNQAVGQGLSELLSHVILRPLDNQREILLALAKTLLPPD